MAYTNLKYKFIFRYPRDWVNNGVSFGNGQMQLFGDKGKIETGISDGSLEQEADAVSNNSDVSTKFIYINNIKVLQKDIIIEPNYGISTTSARAYSISVSSIPPKTFVVFMNNYVDKNFRVINNIIKSIQILK